MRYLKKITLAALAAMAVTAFVGGSTASATTLEVSGVTRNEPIWINASIKFGASATLRDTFGFFANTCTNSTVAGVTSIFTTIVTEKNIHQPTGPILTMTFEKCDHTVTVHKPGKFYVEWTSGTNGTVYSEEAEVTTYSTLHGTHINCTTGTGTPIGTLTGVTKAQEETKPPIGHATMDINATLTCGPHLHSARWTGTYTVTSPTGLGVSP